MTEPQPEPAYVTEATPHPEWCDRPTMPATHIHTGPIGSVRVGGQVVNLWWVQHGNTVEPRVRLELVEADASWRHIDLPAEAARRLGLKTVRGADTIDPQGGELR